MRIDNQQRSLLDRAMGPIVICALAFSLILLGVVIYDIATGVEDTRTAEQQAADGLFITNVAASVINK